MISNGFTYVAFLMCLAGVLLAAEKYTKSQVMKKVFNFVFTYFYYFYFTFTKVKALCAA